MRPLRIELSAFGPYPGTECVDFAALTARGLYVITGPTGSGKTTVFDAMTFALYNAMPLKEAGEIRSHHAAPDAATWVRFTFELDGIEYCVERSPEYERPKKHGVGTTAEKPKAVLVRREPDGTTTSLATRTKDVTDRCTELIGLSAEQFQRVMLLPQGLVSQFLLDGSAKREDLLAQLFGGEVYDRAVAELKAVATERRQTLGRSEEALRHHRATAWAGATRLLRVLGIDPPVGTDRNRVADPATTDDAIDAAEIAELVASVDDAYRALGAAADEAAGIARDADAAAHAADDAARRFDRVRELRRALDELARREAEVMADEAAALASNAARPVVQAAAAAERAAALADRAARELDERRRSIASLAGEVGISVDLSSAGAAVAGLAEAEAKVRADLQLLDASTAHRSEVERLTLRLTAQQEDLDRLHATFTSSSADLATSRADLGEIVARLVDVDALREQGQRLGRARADRLLLVEETKRHEAARIQLEADRRRQAETWRRFVSTQAPRLAAELSEGDPCPVCGSPEHPSPATDHDGTSVSYDEVVAAADSVDRAAAQLRQAEDAVNELFARLGDLADASDAALDDMIEDVDERLVEAERLRVRSEGLTRDVARLENEVAGLDRAITAATATIDSTRTALDDALTQFELANGRCAGLDRVHLEACAVALHSCRRLVDDLESVSAEAARSRTVSDQARAAADEALTTSPFPTVADARDAVLADGDADRRLAAAAAHRDAVAAAGTALQTLLDDGVPDERPAVEELRAVAARAREHAERTAAALQEATIGREDCLDALRLHEAESATTESARRATQLADRAHRVCAGQGTVKIGLRRWVLATELDRVTSAASVHLARMTNGRYTIQRQLSTRDGRSAFGLDLEVLDSHTGRPRRPTSLSGGEQFQASLALALGLADVISHGGSASGRRMEALFIDEGFGSLDPEALDDAIETLHHLRASGRTVGAITHVEAMKEQLHVGIAIERLGSGRGSRLVVTP